MLQDALIAELRRLRSPLIAARVQRSGADSDRKEIDRWMPLLLIQS
jgi:hypothetical protein